MEKSVFFPLKIQKHMQKVRKIAQNAGHTVQNDLYTMRNVGRNTLNVCQGPKGGGLRSPLGPRGPPPTPILEKTLVSRNDF